ncbi:MarR family winged helix-turn-helix transcriptional regulator [Xanthomonas perforans]
MGSITRLETTEAELRSRLRRRFGVGNTDMVALQAIDRAERRGAVLLVTELSPLLGISSPACSALVDRLTVRGHVVRLAVPGNRRARQVALTVRAREALLAAMSDTWARLEALVADLDDVEVRRAVEVIDRVTDALRGGAPIAMPDAFADTEMNSSKS